MASKTAIGSLAALVLLAIAGQSSAIYIVTPLRLSLSAMQAEPGDVVDLQIAPDPEDARGASYGGREVRIEYAYAEADNETVREMTRLMLDADAQGAYAWTVPADVDDRAVAIRIVDDAGEVLAIQHLGVGEGGPVLLAMNGPAQEGATDVPSGDAPPAPDAQPDGAPEDRSVPAAAGVLAVATLGALAIALRRR